MKRIVEWIENHLFGIVYAAIAAYTFWHTTNSIASIFDGSKPSGGITLLAWYFSGALGAIAIDVGMYATANALSKKRSWFMVAAFIVTAASSALTQLIYATQHFQEIQFGTGITEQWKNTLQPIMTALPVVFSFALPSFAVLFTFAKIKRHNDEESDMSEADKLFRMAMEQRGLNDLKISAPVKDQTNNLLPSGTDQKLYTFKCADCNFTGTYKDETTRVRIAKSHVRRMHKDADTDEKIALVLTRSEFKEQIVPVINAEVSITEEQPFTNPVERLEPVDTKPTTNTPIDLGQTQIISVDPSVAGQ